MLWPRGLLVWLLLHTPLAIRTGLTRCSKASWGMYMFWVKKPWLLIIFVLEFTVELLKLRENLFYLISSVDDFLFLCSGLLIFSIPIIYALFSGFWLDATLVRDTFDSFFETMASKLVKNIWCYLRTFFTSE